MSVPAFELPPELEASAPAARRDGVRLLVAGRDGVRHERFTDFARFLVPGDLVVVNTSATLAAAVEARREDGSRVSVHFSTDLGDRQWVVEVRPSGRATGPIEDANPGERIQLSGGGSLRLVDPYPGGQARPRLWRASVAVAGAVPAYLAAHGQPIRYSYVPNRFPLSDYQTVFSRELGSAEMPSAGRPFTADVVLDLVAGGIAIAPITLHTGVSSQEVGEPPLPERFAVPDATARLVNATRRDGNRVVAVGTTVTRALESALDDRGEVSAQRGWTELVLGPDRVARVVSGLVTGWHAPGASHLRLLEAVAGPDLVARAYDEALHERYLWHEFGDSCLLLP